jgi:hypothetical protein
MDAVLLRVVGVGSMLPSGNGWRGGSMLFVHLNFMKIPASYDKSIGLSAPSPASCWIFIS